MTETERQRLKRMLLSLKWMVLKSQIKYYAGIIMTTALCVIAIIILINILLVSIAITYTLDICVSIVTLHKHRDAIEWLGRTLCRLGKLCKRYETKFRNKGSE